MSRATMTNDQLTARAETLARYFVNRWIEENRTTGEMNERAAAVAEHFSAFLLRDIRLFAETGKYPEWAEKAGNMRAVEVATWCEYCQTNHLQDDRHKRRG